MNAVAVDTNVTHGLIVEFSLNGKKTLLESSMATEELFTIGQKTGRPEVNVRIHPKTGIPGPSIDHDGQEGKVLHLNAPLQYMGLVKDEARNLKLTIVGTKTYTYYHFISKTALWVIKVPMHSATLDAAVWNLFLTNMYHGEEHFNRMANSYPRFFEELFKLAFEAPTVLEMAFPGPKNTKVPGKFYLYPQKPEDNIFSVGGQCMGIDLTVFPGDQINRGVTGYRNPREKEEKAQRRVSEAKLRDFLSGNSFGSSALSVKPVQKKVASK